LKCTFFTDFTVSLSTFRDALIATICNFQQSYPQNIITDTFTDTVYIKSSTARWPIVADQ